MKKYIVITIRTIKGEPCSERIIGERSEEQVRRILNKLIDLASTDQYESFDLMKVKSFETGDSFSISICPKGSDYTQNNITVRMYEKTW